MLKSIALLVIAILLINVVVIGISLIQQTGKVNQASANVTSLESKVSGLTGEITALQNNIADLLASITESEAKSAALQTELNKVNTDLLNALRGITVPLPTPPVNPTGPAAFVTSDLKINEILLQPADTATVSVTVTNTGAETGTYPVVLKLNGETFATKSVTLDGGKNEVVVFGVNPGKELKAVITVDNLSVAALWEVH
ncbi:MAG: hypothetical protein Q7J73_01890 [Dehalococcoidales bacterium]|nr:hypothetical protein [Dehalococcoidales bacterium]